MRLQPTGHEALPATIERLSGMSVPRRPESEVLKVNHVEVGALIAPLEKVRPACA